MKVLSLFDGISCGMIALERAGIKVDTYYASEIKDFAIKCSKANYPNIVQLGDVNNIDFSSLGHIDLLIGGSPCQGISLLNQNHEGLAHNKSFLFYKYLQALTLLRKKNPNIKFLLENTRGKKETIDTMSSLLGVEPININSRLVSAQNRPRKYWTNIDVNTLLTDKGITMSDILIDEWRVESEIPSNRKRWLLSESGQSSIKKGFTRVNPTPKASCLTKTGLRTWNCNYIERGGQYRFLYREELERLQTMPIGYCDCLTYAETYDVLGDGWTIDVIAYILKHLI